MRGEHSGLVSNDRAILELRGIPGFAVVSFAIRLRRAYTTPGMPQRRRALASSTS